MTAADPAQNQQLRQENEKLKLEVNRLKLMLENCSDGAVGGIDISDSNSVDASSTDGGSTVAADRLEIELRAARQQVSSEFVVDIDRFNQQHNCLIFN